LFYWIFKLSPQVSSKPFFVLETAKKQLKIISLF